MRGKGKRNRLAVHMSSAKMTWRSPTPLIKRLKKAWKKHGGIGLDPCASSKRKHWFASHNLTGDGTSKDDGLDASWRGYGLVYANPVYGYKLKTWIMKAVYEFRHKEWTAKEALRCENDELILLTPARTDTRWFHDHLLPYVDAVCFIKGRLHFDDKKHPAPFPSMLTYIGTRKKLFKQVCKRLGLVIMQ